MLAALNVILNMLLCFSHPETQLRSCQESFLCAERVSGLPGSQGFNLIWQAE